LFICYHIQSLFVAHSSD